MRKLRPDITKSELSTYTLDHWKSLEPIYRTWAKRWKRTIEFLRSQHWNVLQEQDLQEVPKWRRLPTIDLTLRVYADIMGKWLQSNVRYSAVPASGQPSDIAAADLAESLLKFSWKLLDMDAKRIDLAAWLISTGNGVLRVFWDTDTGNMVPLAIPGRDGQLIPVNPETLQPDPTMREPVLVDAGEIGVEVMSPQLVRFPRSKKDGVLAGMLLNEDEVWDRYGEENFEKARFSKIDPSLTLDLSFMQDPTSLSMGQDRKRALIIEHYVPRSKQFPGGLWWTLDANSKEFLTQPAPLPGGEPPIVHFRWIPVPGTRVATTPLYGITFSNKLYDEISGKIQEWAIRVVPKLVRKEGDGLEFGQFNDEPMQEVVVNVGAEPDFPTPPPVPQHLFEMLQKNISDVTFVAGYDLSDPEAKPKKGTVLTNRIPHTEERRDEVALLEIVSKPSWEHLGRLVLAYAKSFYTEGRVLPIVGEDKLYQWIEFEAETLNKLPQTVQVDEIPLYTHNRQALRDTVIGLMGTPAAQVIFSDIDESGQPILDKDRIEIAMSAMGVDTGLADLDPDIAEARNEHALILQGEQIQPEAWQNTPVHIGEHKRFMKGMRFRSWPEQARQALIQHLQASEQIVSEAAEAQQQGMVEFEKSMRDVRETAELQAEVKLELAKVIIEAVGEGFRQAVADLMGQASVPPKKEKKSE